MIRYGVLVAGWLMVAGCAGAPPPSSAGLDYAALMAAPVRPVTPRQVTVLHTAQSLLGVPYRAGGETPAGFDCTGFVRYVFREAEGLLLPRRSIEQVQFGDPVSPIEMRAGDLVFFRIERQRSLHVGIYTGEGRFIHAPSTHGYVNTQSLGIEYWRTRFLGARRVMPVSAGRPL